MLTVKAVADRLGVGVHAVLGWIAAGELSAVNVARNRAGERPRWRISADALQQFELGRLAPPPPVRGPRRKKLAEVTQFYK